MVVLATGMVSLPTGITKQSPVQAVLAAGIVALGNGMINKAGDIIALSSGKVWVLG